VPPPGGGYATLTALHERGLAALAARCPGLVDAIVAFGTDATVAPSLGAFLGGTAAASTSTPPTTVDGAGVEGGGGLLAGRRGVGAREGREYLQGLHRTGSWMHSTKLAEVVEEPGTVGQGIVVPA
jgi:hypothetical protein